MNIETANRLLQYRKKNNLSQEELAEKIGVSRQAISKWERAEASPDTDNLIELSKIYGVSLDSLIRGENEDNQDEQQNAQDSKNGNSIQFNINNNGKKKSVDVHFIGDDSNSQKTDSTGEDKHEEPINDGQDHVLFKNGIHVHAKNGDKVDIGFNGIHVHENGGDHVDVGWNGVHVNEKGGDHVNIDKNGVFINTDDCKATTDKDGNVYVYHNSERTAFFHSLKAFPMWAVTLILYLLFGFLNICGGWAAGWLVFFLIPLYYSTVEAIEKKSFNIFPYPVFITAVYLYLGMIHHLWHPMWILFLTIPCYYCIVECFKKTKR